MLAWTPAERRGALLVALLLALAAARDLWRAARPERAPEPLPSAAAAGAEAAHPAGGAGAPLDLNRAGAAELDALPGIGPVLAGRILQYRERHGPFRDAQELLAVPGIGPRLFARLEPLVRAGPAPARGPDSAGPAPGGSALVPGPGDAANGNSGVAGRLRIPVQDSGRTGR